MNHHIEVERYGVRLRPVTMEDAPFIYQLRTTPELAHYIGEFSKNYEDHLLWLKAYFQRQGDYYFIIELSSGISAGAISIYDVLEDKGKWGRWIIHKAYPVASASAWLIYYTAFEILGLQSVDSNTVLVNKQIVSFHDRCGIARIGIEPEALRIGGIDYDTVIHRASRSDWPLIQQRLEPSCLMVERLLQRSQ